jgi:biotin carboxyl carrier protein
MKVEVRLTGPSAKESRVVEIERDANGLRVLCDGQPVVADAVEVAPHTFSILVHGQSFEVRVAPSLDGKLKVQTGAQEFTAEVIDPRAWSRRHQGGAEAAGRQQILAPMPGKVVRLLVKAGEHVETAQGLIVVEAMKMQNEIRSPKSGIVGRVLAKEGQAVNAGELLAWVE